jgi:hypothetical protein
MASYFARHKVDKRADNFGSDEDPSTGYIAWLLWGGDAGQKWAEEQARAIEANKKDKALPGRHGKDGNVHRHVSHQ